MKTRPAAFSAPMPALSSLACTSPTASFSTASSSPLPRASPAARAAPGPSARPARMQSVGNSSLGGSGPAPVPPPKRRAPRAPDYAVNVGAAIEALRADYPAFLERAPDMAVYAQNVVLKDRPSGYRLGGREAYARLCWALRMQAAFCFSSAGVAIHSLYYDDDAGVIYLRWRLQGSLRVWGLISRPPVVVVDAMSIYGLNSEGRICEHTLDPTVPQKPRRLRPFVEEVLALGTIRKAPTLEPVATSRSALATPEWYQRFDEVTWNDLPEGVARVGRQAFEE